VAECAVIGVKDKVKGQIPCGFLVLKNHVSRETSEIAAEVAGMVRNEIGPVAAFKTVMVVPKLPKTRSGKILRGTMQKIADDMPWTMPATIEDPGTLDVVRETLWKNGFAHQEKSTAG
jgi:propionyl-CoA synthetase